MNSTKNVMLYNTLIPLRNAEKEAAIALSEMHIRTPVALLLFVVCSLLLLLLTVSQRDTQGYKAEGYNDPSYLSTLQISSPQGPLQICVPTSYMPCTKTLKALRSIEAPLTPKIDIGGLQTCELSCSDLVTLSLTDTHDTLVAACPGNDLVLSVVACLGQGRLPPIPLTSRGLTLTDVAVAGDTVLCAGLAETRLIADICACTGITIPTSLIQENVPVGRETSVYLRPAGNADVVTALTRKNATLVLLPDHMDPILFAQRQPLASLNGERISSTCVLVGKQFLDTGNEPRVRAVVESLMEQDPFWALGELNLASKSLPKSITLLPLTRALLRPIDAAALTRQESSRLTTRSYAIPSVNILREAFAVPESRITLRTYAPVEAYMTHTARDGKSRVLVMREAFIGAARMRVGDRVILTEQPVQKHDGEYIVQACHSNGTTTLVSWCEASYDAVSFTDVAQTTTAAVVMNMNLKTTAVWPVHVSLQIGDLLLLRNLHTPDGGTGIWTKVMGVRDSSVTLQTVLPKDSHTDASDGSCVTSPATEIKSVCRAEKHLWDAPCTSDDQCPYFQKNLHYPNYRGGCLESGWCEMPLGVFQSSYRTAVGTAVCHDSQEACTDTAFPLDEFERRVFGFTP